MMDKDYVAMNFIFLFYIEAAAKTLPIVTQ